MKFSYDIIVVGAGHAGCEAPVRRPEWARGATHHYGLGKIAQMSCNPSVGGIAKGQIVREIDALGA